MRWPLVFYTDKLVPAGSAGAMRVILLPCVFIRPAYKGDEGLLAHELVHVKQALRWLIFPHVLLYTLWDEYRLSCEVEAYREQLRYSPGSERRFAGFVATKYNIDVTVDEVMEMLRHE